MAFLTEKDYQVQIRTWIKNYISNNDTELLELAEQSAQEEMETYLNNRYDVGKIFDMQLPKSDRSQLIVMYMVDIAVYHLHTNVTPNDIPEIRQLRYNNALRWLNKVNKGSLNPDLPLLKNEDGDPEAANALHFFGNSNEPYSERY